MMRKLLILAALLPALASAEHAPPPGRFDPRVRMVAYNPQELVSITAYFGVSTPIRFAEGEVIEPESLDAGDRSAWSIKASARKNILFVRPIAFKADTNLTVVTNKRVYLFLLNVLPAPGQAGKKKKRGAPVAAPLDSLAVRRSSALTYSLTFTYPEDDKARAGEARAAGELRAQLANPQARCTNDNYWAAGDDSIKPTDACDDGRFMYLTFSRNRTMPAIYSIDASGKASMVNVAVNGNTITVDRMARKLVLRDGDAVACIVNHAFNPDGGADNTTSTISPGVVRVFKGAQP